MAKKRKTATGIQGIAHRVLGLEEENRIWGTGHSAQGTGLRRGKPYVGYRA